MTKTRVKMGSPEYIEQRRKAGAMSLAKLTPEERFAKSSKGGRNKVAGKTPEELSAIGRHARAGHGKKLSYLAAAASEPGDVTAAPVSVQEESSIGADAQVRRPRRRADHASERPPPNINVLA